MSDLEARVHNLFIGRLQKLVDSIYEEAGSGWKIRSGAEEMADAALQAITRTRQLLQELQLCIKVDATFAGTVIGCSTLEGLLIVACLGRKSQVVTTKAWHNFAKRKHTFVQNIGRIDLGILLSVATELGWFAKNIVPDDLIDYLLRSAPGAAENFKRARNELSESGGSGGDIVAVTAKSLRNFLHVGKCIRERISVDPQGIQVGYWATILAIFSFLVSIE